jgi:hypothetical protein
MAAATFDDEDLQRIYTWVDDIPLSRPKRNITRDFSDGGEWCECACYGPMAVRQRFGGKAVRNVPRSVANPAWALWHTAGMAQVWRAACKAMGPSPHSAAQATGRSGHGQLGGTTTYAMVL